MVCCGWHSSHCDRTCGYKTPVIVNIRDWRLGLLRWSLLLILSIYVILYQILYKCTYVLSESPVGTVRFSFQMPTYNPTTKRKACDPLDAGCEANFHDLDKLEYCLQSKSKHSKEMYNCTYWDDLDDVTIQQSSALLTTRVTTYLQEEKCKPSSGVVNCKAIWKSEERPNIEFIADVEAYTVLLDHSVVAPNLDIGGSSREWAGYLRTDSETLCANHPNRTSMAAIYADVENVPQGALSGVSGPPCLIKPNDTYPSTGLDVFDVGVLLEADSVHLDEISDTSSHHTTRYTGSTLVVSINYRNYAPWKGVLFNSKGNYEVPYTYTVKRIDKSTAKQMKQISTKFPDKRVVRNEHGVKFYVIQTGSIGRFDAFSLLLSITTSLTLLALANLLVDSIAVYVMPEREYFSSIKYPDSKVVSESRRSLTADISDSPGGDGNTAVYHSSSSYGAL